MSFHVGQLVECVNARDMAWPVVSEGGKYIIAAIKAHELFRILASGTIGPGVGLKLEGVPLGERQFLDATRFRPIVENKSSVSFTMGADPESERWDNRKKIKEKVGSHHH